MEHLRFTSTHSMILSSVDSPSVHNIRFSRQGNQYRSSERRVASIWLGSTQVRTIRRRSVLAIPDQQMLGEVDSAFIQPVEHRPKPTIIEADAIPVIDLSQLFTIYHSSKDNDPKDIGNLVADIREACEKWGFFQVINHGVPLEKLGKLEQAAREFFALPMEEKRKVSRGEENPMGYYDSEHTKNVRDWKQVFDFTAKDPTFAPVAPDQPEPKQLLNRWPDSPSELRVRVIGYEPFLPSLRSDLLRITREAAQEYAREVEKLAFKLVGLIALSLGVEASRLEGFFEDHLSFVRLNHYPPCPSPHLVLGVTRHKDAGALTILAQDDVGGLQVRRKSDGEWVCVKPTPGAFIINIGDVVQVWSNDKYESVEHRVIVNSEKDRLSIPFFFNPSHYVMVKPLEELVDEQNPPKYKEYNWGIFYATKRKSNLKKLHVENLQISHFKISE